MSSRCPIKMGAGPRPALPTERRPADSRFPVALRSSIGHPESRRERSAIGHWPKSASGQLPRGFRPSCSAAVLSSARFSGSLPGPSRCGCSVSSTIPRTAIQASCECLDVVWPFRNPRPPLGIHRRSMDERDPPRKFAQRHSPIEFAPMDSPGEFESPRPSQVRGDVWLQKN